MIIQDPFGPCCPLYLPGNSSLHPPPYYTVSDTPVRAFFNSKATLSAHLSLIHPSHLSFLIFTFIFRIFLPFAFYKMWGMGYWLLGDEPGSQGDSVSLTTRLGQPQMNKPPISCGREMGAFLGSAKECM